MTTRSMEELELAWQAALESEDAEAVEAMVRELLLEHPESRLTCELRYQRGMLTLLEGEGTGMERLAKATAEFEEGAKIGQKVGESAEPWRTLNRTQLGVCMARRGNIEAAEAEIKAASAYRPRTAAGLGGLSLLTQLLEEAGKIREARRYNSQRISYARALVRENPEPPELYTMQLLLSQELLDSEYEQEGKELLQQLAGLDIDAVGEDLYEEIQAQFQLLEDEA